MMYYYPLKSSLSFGAHRDGPRKETMKKPKKGKTQEQDERRAATFFGIFV